MKRFSEILNSAYRAAAAIAVAALFGSCSMLHDDLPDCATRPDTRATVNFIYDFNTAEKDAFAEQIGAVTLYVFDEAGKLVMLKEHTAAGNGINAEDYTMPVQLPFGKYSLYASARENTAGYDASLLTPGAKFRRSGDSQGNAISQIIYALDHQEGWVDHQRTPLEHLWLTHEAVPFEMTEASMPAEGEAQPEDVVLNAVVPLKRVTNHLHLTITREFTTRAGEEAISPDDYDVRVVTVDASDRLDLLGNLKQDGSPLTFTPHSLTSTTTNNGRPCLQAEISTSRILHEGDATKHAKLSITSKLTGETTSWDLPELLSRGLEAYPGSNWTKQEYIDRESDFTIAVEFKQNDDGWRYIEISIAQLSWTKRIQNEQL